MEGIIECLHAFSYYTCKIKINLNLFKVTATNTSEVEGVDDSGTKDFDIHSLSRNILGQHGGELLLDIDNSIFYPGILGIICLRTKVCVQTLFLPPT